MNDELHVGDRTNHEWEFNAFPSASVGVARRPAVDRAPEAGGFRYRRCRTA